MQMKSVNLKQSNDGSMHATLMYFQSFTQNLVDQFEERRARRQRQPMDATVVEGTQNVDQTGTNKARYDKNTLESIREIMGQIKTTLAGALHDNMQRAVDRIAECQLVGDYTGRPLRNSPAYHVGFYEHLADAANPDIKGKPRHERMRKSLKLVDANGDSLLDTYSGGREAEENNRYMADMNAWNLKKVSPNTESIHEACWKSSFFKVADDQTDDIESLWKTSEQKRKEHRAARLTRQSSCGDGDANACETYDNFRWYDDNALLKSYPCKYASMESGVGSSVSAERPDPQTSVYALKRMDGTMPGCTGVGGSGECNAFNGRDMEIGGKFDTIITDAETFIPREVAFAPEYLAATKDVEVAEMENCLFKTKAWLEGLYGKYRDCMSADSDKNSKDRCTEEKATCDHKQHDFEIARCWWAVDHDYHCSTYVTCVTNKFKDNKCNTLCRDVRAITLRNKADYETGERIQCLLEALFGSVNPNYDPNTYDAAKDSTWPLIPRKTDNEALLNMDGGDATTITGNENNMEGEDETAKWVKWCHSDGASLFDKAAVLKRFYNNTASDAPTKLGLLPDGKFTNPTFAEILDYEKRYFDLRCTGDGDANGVAESTSRMFGLRLPLKDSTEAVDTTVELDPAKDLATAKAYGKHPRGVISPLGLGYKECTTGTFYRHPLANTQVSVADAYNVQNGYYEIPENNQGSTFFLQHCNEMALESMVSYSLELPTQWSSWEAVTYKAGVTMAGDQPATSEAGHLWHPKHQDETSRNAGFEGGVLYLTTLAKAFALEFAAEKPEVPADPEAGTKLVPVVPAVPLHTNEFDCTELPVPGEKKTCSRSEMRRYPYRGCWVDVYRSDSLRAEVPFCDITQQSKKTAKLSHASFFNGVEGCTGTSKFKVDATSSDSAFVSCAADLAVTNWNSDASGAFYSDDNFNSANSIVGTCCTQAEWEVRKTESNFQSALGDRYTATSGMYKEAIDGTTTNAYSEYKCAGQYMFTHAEREAAFGSENQIGHNYYGETSNPTFGGFNGDNDIRNTDTDLDAEGYWYKNQDYAEQLGKLSGAKESAYAATSTDGTLATKSEWSISSDIQGVYKVVASTDVLGTECALRSGEKDIKNVAVTNA